MPLVLDLVKTFAMYSALLDTIHTFQQRRAIRPEREQILSPLIDFVRQKIKDGLDVNINFICTHNSRRSHLAQIWAQTAASYFGLPAVHCYSGGTEETALFPKIAETLGAQGFNVLLIADGANPVYAIKEDDNAPPLIGFSKKWNDPFNPRSAFAAVMTCSQADQGCPFIAGAEKRIAIPFEDPKTSDGTAGQTDVYAESSLEIATEMFYVFSKIKTDNHAAPAQIS